MSHRETDEKQKTREDEQEHLIIAKENHDKKTKIPFKQQSMKGTIKQSRKGKTVQQTEDDEYTYEDYLCETYNDQYNDYYNDRYLLEDRQAKQQQTKQQAKKSTTSAKEEEEKEYTYEDYCEDERCAHYNDPYVREDREQSRARYGMDRRCR
jgi:topoisomerase IA-like protein